MINPGWDDESALEDDSCVQQCFASVPLPKLCPHGFVFVWAEKHRIAAVTRQMYKWGYIYVENLTWVSPQSMHKERKLSCSFASWPCSCTFITSHWTAALKQSSKLYP